ncbi:OmpA family protein [Sphingosinicella sp. CPCC 101087]|uniref:OmpA family protein n=1 Tax=Sphingosinicella sp. CPCC 101087 TaxID=2497754 RepID=UPI00101D5133|nr:OmpA family protein [Sphingosinicella sp. CPCC 101087]
MTGRLRTASIGLAAAVALVAGCGEGGFLSGGGGGAAVDAQVAHPGGVVLQILSLRADGERALVDLRVLNGRDREIRLNQGRENSYILTDSGEKLLLVPPAGNPNLAVPGGRSADLALVFEGALPRSGTATLVLNEDGSMDSVHSSDPRFDVSLPLAGAGGGGIPEVSAMSNLRPNPATALRPAAAPGSSLAAGAQRESSLQAVDALKSELGAVETDRGTMVSLPGDVTFDFDRATIRADARPTLDRLVALIEASGEGEISIEGHTDSKGEDAYNRRLSEQRAEAVKAYLASKGVAEDRLSTLGLGETRPVAPNAKPDGSDDEEGRQRNRRVEVILPAGAAPEE